jgi:hypothetical protein
MEKFIEMTGSPKSAGFSTKEAFLSALSNYGYVHSKITKKNNKVSILVTDDIDSNTTKMQTAKELGIEIMTYLEIKEQFNLDGDYE